jgi:hypothetical protein
VEKRNDDLGKSLGRYRTRIEGYTKNWKFYSVSEFHVIEDGVIISDVN